MSINYECKQTPKYLWFLTLSFSMTLAISNWYDARLIYLFGVTITPGALCFPLTFALSDVITEVYGYKNARRAIWASLFFNSIFIIFGKLVTTLPSPPFLNHNSEFDNLINLDLWIIIASFTSYIISEPLNSYINAKAKLKANGHYIGLRFIGSTIAASAIDTPIFVIIAFHKSLTFDAVQSLIIPIFLIKCVVELAVLPISIKAAETLKEKEGIDIYDTNTNFNPFSLDVDYSTKNTKG
jgi:queuosine precursor transporter